MGGWYIYPIEREEMSQRGKGKAGGHRQCHGLKKGAEPLAELEDTDEKIPEGQC